MPNINEFKSRLRGGGARSNQFKVTLPFPGYAAVVNWLIYWAIDSSSSLDAFCKLPKLSPPSPNPAKGHYGDPEIK